MCRRFYSELLVIYQVSEIKFVWIWEWKNRPFHSKKQMMYMLFRILISNSFVSSVFDQHQELEALADPMRKEVALVRKRIDSVNKELKPLGHTCQKKVKYWGNPKLLPNLLKLFIPLCKQFCKFLCFTVSEQFIIGEAIEIGCVVLTGERIQRSP